MEIEINFDSPKYGGGSHLGEFLIDGLPDVGTGVEKIEVDVLLRSEPRVPREQPVGLSKEETLALFGLPTEGEGAGPLPGLEQMHEEQRSKGPALTFRRAARRVSMRIISELSELDVFGPDDVTLEVFAATAREIVAGLEGLPRRIKPGDDFDAQTFLSFIRARLDVLPRNQEELDGVLAQAREAAAQRWEAMDEWERLDVDWSVFTADARARFPDPFFFDSGNEEAPHGNDAGSDVLAAYLTERPEDGLDFLDAQLRDMGYESLSGFASIDIAEHDEMVLAAVFADLMVRGNTSAELKQLAFRALDRRQADAPSPRNEQMRRALA